MVESNPFSPRFRIYGEVAEFENERQLEWFFWHTVLVKIGLTPLKNQYSCKEGICDILAKGTDNELIVIELKVTPDSHVIEQITAYFDALNEEKPFAEQIDYSKPIKLYTVCPSYGDRTKLVLKYHKLDVTLFSYTVKSYNQRLIFTLHQWQTNTEVVLIEISSATAITPEFNLPEAPKSFIDLTGKCSEDEKQWVMQVRDQIYQFAQKHNHKIHEKPAGSWIRFERNKQNPIAEVGWDNKRNILAIYLWLPFITINGNLNVKGPREKNYKRTAMMRLWIVDGIVKHIGYVENGNKGWLVVTNDELQSGTFSKPVKLKKWMNQYRHSSASYWKGLAMPTQFYLKTMGFTIDSHSLNTFVELALEHSLQRLNKDRQKDVSETTANE